MANLHRKSTRQKRRIRIRKKISGTPERPRLAVSFSNSNVYAQLIDDGAGKTLAAASTLDKSVGKRSANKDTAAQVGKLIAERAKEKKIEDVVFDRGGFIFHGKVKALADAARDGGLKF